MSILAVTIAAEATHALMPPMTASAMSVFFVFFRISFIARSSNTSADGVSVIVDSLLGTLFEGDPGSSIGVWGVVCVIGGAFYADSAL